MEIIDKIFQTDLNKEKEKKQILLTHSGRNIMDYMMSIKYRFNGVPKKLPHYLIGRDGKVVQVLEDKYNSNFSSNDRVNSKSIVICLENLGWLEKVPLKLHHINWIGNIYKGDVFDKKWRDYFFWQPYTESQINSLAELCNELSKEMKIKPNLIGHNTKLTGIEKYEGIVVRSNFDVTHTDVNPSFNFEEFLKKIENE